MTRLVLASTQASFAWLPAEQRDRFARMLAVFQTDWESPTVTNIMVELLAPDAADVSRRVLGEFLRRSTSGASIAGFFGAHLGIDASGEARRISAPTLVIHARDDTVVRIEAGRTLAALIPNVRFEVVEGGHREGIGNTPEVRARILSFFDEEPTAAVAAR